MTVISENPVGNLISKTVKAIAAHPVTTGAILTGLGSIVTFSVLFAYLNAIGHPELLSPALASPAALLPWIIITALMLELYLGGLMIASAFYASALAFFNHKPNDQPYMAITLMLPALAGISAMVASLIIYQHAGAFLALSLSALAVVAVILLMLLIPKFKSIVKEANQPGDEASSITQAKRTANVVGLIATIWGTGLSAMFPIFLLINSHPWPAHRFELIKFAGICILLTVIGLFPAAAFYICRDGFWTRTRYTLGAMVFVVASAFYFVPTTVPKVVDKTATLIGIKSLEVSWYMIKDTYSAEDFDSSWGKVETLRGSPVVEGFPLFTLGDLLLLCPQSLASTDLTARPHVTHACLVVDVKTTKKMPEKIVTI